jgi:hypothetical protein
VTVRDPAQLTCQEVVELVTELLADSLAPEDRIRVEQHLLVCPPCTLHVGQVKATIELTGELHDTATVADLDPALTNLFRNWRRK